MAITVHATPLRRPGRLTPCCRRTLTDLPPDDLLDGAGDQVTCPRPADPDTVEATLTVAAARRAMADVDDARVFFHHDPAAVIGRAPTNPADPTHPSPLDGSGFPLRHAVVFCDACGANEIEGDIRADTRSDAFDGVRRMAVAAGWMVTPAADYCPNCAPRIRADSGGPWTLHGATIPGLTVTGRQRPTAHRCGGPAICQDCRREAEYLLDIYGPIRGPLAGPVALAGTPEDLDGRKADIARLATLMASTRPDDADVEGEWAIRLHDAGVRVVGDRP